MEPLVSVVCITYNHAEFIESALKSFVSQKTSFPFEIVVHDDCSTDGTDLIIKKYAKKYPELIVPVFEEENCYNKGIVFSKRLYSEQSRGKYVAVCEGDDYWCDEYKLEKQVKYMKEHEDCSLLMHNGYSLNCKTGKKVSMNPYEASRIISDIEVIIEGKVMPPTASMFFKRKDIVEMPDFFWKASVGDRTRRMYLILKGHIYYMEDLMCVYRMNVPGSFTQRAVQSEEVRLNTLKKMIDFFDNYNNHTEHKYSNEIEFVKSREYFHYYLRGNQKKKAFKTEYFQKMYSFTDKLKMYISAYMPDSLKKKLKSLFFNT